MTKEKRPMISVVIPTFNRADYILESLESVYAQSYTDYEIIVVDDGSTDNTQDLLAPAVKSRKIRFELIEHGGVSAARNRGVEIAEGSYIAFLDSDDLFLPEKLIKQMKIFRDKPQLGFVHANFSKFNNAGEDLGVRDMTRFQGMVYPGILQEWSYLMALPCILVRREVFFEAEGFDESLSWGEDLDLFIRISKGYEVGIVPEVLCKVRVHEASASASKLGAAENFHHVLEKAFKADADLGKAFKRRAFANMYTNKGQNLLGEGKAEEIQIARGYLAKAISYWPFVLGAWTAMIASLFPVKMRSSLAKWIRKKRYPRANM